MTHGFEITEGVCGCTYNDERKKSDEQMLAAKSEIDALSHEEICRAWRFGTGRKEWFDSTEPISSYFKERLFNHFGGFTPEISKRIGW